MNGEQEKLLERIKSMHQLMNQAYAKEQSLNSQQMLQLSEEMDKLILEFLTQNDQHLSEEGLKQSKRPSCIKQIMNQSGF